MNFGKDIVDEGDFGQLVCTVVRGDEPLTFTWSLQGDVVSSEPGLMTSQLGTRTSILMINTVGHRHIGKYTCNVSNVAGSVSATAELKVNGTLDMILLKPFFSYLRSMESIGWFLLFRSGCCTIDL